MQLVLVLGRYALRLELGRVQLDEGDEAELVEVESSTARRLIGFQPELVPAHDDEDDEDELDRARS